MTSSVGPTISSAPEARPANFLSLSDSDLKTATLWKDKQIERLRNAMRTRDFSSVREITHHKFYRPRFRLSSPDEQLELSQFSDDLMNDDQYELALEVVRGVSEDKIRDFAVSKIAESFINKTDFQTILKIIEGIEDKFLRDDLSEALVKIFSDRKAFEQAIVIAHKITYRLAVSAHLVRICDAQVQSGDLDGAIQVTEMINDPHNLMTALQIVSKALARRKDLKKGDLLKALALAKKISEKRYREEAFVEIVLAIESRPGALCRRFGMTLPETCGVSYFHLIAIGLVECGKLDAASIVAEMIEDTDKRAEVVRLILEKWPL